MGIFVPPAYAHRPHDVVTAVELSNHYHQDQTVFIIVRDNLFKSTNGGLSWQRLGKDLDYRYELTSLELDSQNPVILFLASKGDGIFRSMDSGSSWQKVNNGLESLEIEALAISAAFPENLIAIDTNHSLYQTTNRAQTWTKVLTLDQKVTALEFSPWDATNLAFLGTEMGELLSSTDGGRTWQNLSDQAIGLDLSGAITAIEFLPVNHQNTQSTALLLGTAENGIFQTLDGGLSWSEISDGLPQEPVLDLVAIAGEPEPIVFASTWESGVYQLQGQVWQRKSEGLHKDPQGDQLKQPHFDDLEIVINDPNNPIDSDLFVGGFDGLFKSENNGETWQGLETLLRGTVVDLAISPNYKNDGTIVVVTYVGDIYLSRDRGQTWQPINQGVEIPRLTGSFREVDINLDPRRFFDTAFSPTYEFDQTFFASLLWTKLLHTHNQGKSWQITALAEEVRGLTIAPSPNFAEDKTVYLSNQQGKIYQSKNAGRSFKIVGKIPPLRGNYGPSLVISPNFSQDQTLFASGDQGIYRSQDGGKTWEALTAGTALAEQGKLQLAISPTYPTDQTLWVSTNQQLFQSKNRGETWTTIDNIIPRIPGTAEDSRDSVDLYLEGIGISPNYGNDRTFIVSVRSQGLFKTTDDGQTFQAIGDPNLSFAHLNSVPSSGSPIQFSPDYTNDQTLYGFGAANTAIFKSIDGGKTWETLAIPVPETAPYSFTTRLNLWFYINGSRLVKLGIVTGGLLLGYLALSYLSRLRRSLVMGVWKGVIITVLALGLFFRFGNLDQKVYSADEVRSILRLSGYTSDQFKEAVYTGEKITVADLQITYQRPNDDRSLGDAFLALAGNPEHPPLYHLLTRFWMQMIPLFHGARIGSILIALFSFPCIYWLAIELFCSPLVAWIMVLFVAVSPFHIMAAQNTTQYSLWTLIIALSSTLFLRAVRQGTQRSWGFYALSVAAGFYAHLFFTIVAFGHGVTLLLAKPLRSWQNISAYLFASLGAVFLFSPWLWIILNNLDKIEENTRYYRQFDNNLKRIINRFIYNLGNVFLDFHDRSRVEYYFDLLLVVLVLYALYFLWRNTDQRTRIFVLTLIVITPLVYTIPDLISPSARSLQTRYYLPCFLGIELALAFLIAGYMQLVVGRVWQQRLGQLTLLGLLSCGILSGVFILQTGDWGLDDQRGTASGLNLQVAPVINQTEHPLVISNANHSFVLALTYLLENQTELQLVPDQPDTWAKLLTPSDLARDLHQFSAVFLYLPTPELLNWLETDLHAKIQVVNQGGRKLLYQVIEDQPGIVEESEKSKGK